MGKIQAIFFDIDDTLYSTTEFAKLARRNALEAMRKYGLKLPIDYLMKELDEITAEFSSNYDKHFDKLLLRIPESSYEGVNSEILVAAGIIAYHQAKSSQLKPYDDVIPFLKKLSTLPTARRQAGTQIIRGIISAGLEVKQHEKILRLGIYEYLTPTAIFISDQIGIGKPNPKLFQRACADACIKPQEAIYVGNSLLNDIEPAKKIGMIAILCSRGAKKEEKTETNPDYTIGDFRELARVLSSDFKIDI